MKKAVRGETAPLSLDACVLRVFMVRQAVTTACRVGASCDMELTGSQRHQVKEYLCCLGIFTYKERGTSSQTVQDSKLCDHKQVS